MLNNYKTLSIYFKKKQDIKRVLKAERIREKITSNELLTTQTDLSHKQNLKVYLKQIRSNILKLNCLLTKLNNYYNIPKLSVTKLVQEKTELFRISPYYLK